MTTIKLLGVASICVLFLWTPPRARAEIIVPPQMANLVSPQVTETVAFDSGTGLYTYSYSLKNKNSSQQNIESFTLETGATVINPTSPQGWIFVQVNLGSSTARLSWGAVSLPAGYVDDGSRDIPESPDTIKPGETLTGFSFQSASPPDTLTYYAEGWVPIARVDGDIDELIDAGYDLDQLAFPANAASGTVDGPGSECKDGIDNDGDGDVDLFDSGCRDRNWPTEEPGCSNGLDDDGDGDVDFPVDTDCHTLFELSEEGDCDDGIDNNLDTLVDFPADGGCTSAADASEDPDCSDRFDNDGDGLIDGDDPGCKGTLSPRENPACDDGIDNDGNGDTDYPDDLKCSAPFDESELADCDDGIDNDGDGAVDILDADCRSAGDASEIPDCADGLDNDGDGEIDYPADPDCSTPGEQREGSGGCGLLGIEVVVAFRARWVWRRRRA